MTIMFSRREAINELTPVEQLLAINKSCQRFRDTRFHKEARHKCDGKLLVIEDHMYACDICGEEQEQ